MDSLCNTAQLLCTRCQDAPRLPGQRWCRPCLTAAQRQRRAAQRVAQAADRTGLVTQAAIQARSPVPQHEAPALPEARPALVVVVPQASRPPGGTPEGGTLGVPRCPHCGQACVWILGMNFLGTPPGGQTALPLTQVLSWRGGWGCQRCNAIVR